MFKELWGQLGLGEETARTSPSKHLGSRKPPRLLSWTPDSLEARASHGAGYNWLGEGQGDHWVLRPGRAPVDVPVDAPQVSSPFTHAISKSDKYTRASVSPTPTSLSSTHPGGGAWGQG